MAVVISDTGYRRRNHATIERTALTCNIVVIGKRI
jgi:hypothetical protein